MIREPGGRAARERPRDAEAQSAVRTGQVALEVFSIDHQTYAAERAALVAIEPALADGVAGRLRISGADRTRYALAVASDSGTTFTVVRDAAGVIRRGCSEPGAGRCRADGTW